MACKWWTLLAVCTEDFMLVAGRHSRRRCALRRTAPKAAAVPARRYASTMTVMT